MACPNQIKVHYIVRSNEVTADATNLPGTPPIGFGANKREALLHLLLCLAVEDGYTLPEIV